MIYIIEVPHQRHAFCWSAIDEQDALNRINEDLAGRHMTEEADNFEEAIRLNGADLHAQYVLDVDEAREAIGNDGEHFSPHQRGRALAALRAAMIEVGDYQVSDDDEKVASIALDVPFEGERGDIRVGETDAGWQISVLRSDGESESDGATFASRKEALEAIDLMWGRDGAGVWDLQWV